MKHGQNGHIDKDIYLMSNNNKDDSLDILYTAFQEWYKQEQRHFHCAQMNEQEIAYAAFNAGIQYCRRRHYNDI